MSHWRGKLVVREHPQGWELVEPLAYGEWSTEPGTLTDFESIPKMFRSIFHVGHPKSIKPAVIHDDACRSKRTPRQVADAVFYDLLVAGGVPKLRAGLMWAAVRAGGGLSGASPREAAQVAAYGLLALLLFGPYVLVAWPTIKLFEFLERVVK